MSTQIMTGALAADSKISHYRIISKIGEGGMGECISLVTPNWIATNGHGTRSAD